MKADNAKGSFGTKINNAWISNAKIDNAGISNAGIGNVGIIIIKCSVHCLLTSFVCGLKLYKKILSHYTLELLWDFCISGNWVKVDN